MTGCVYDVQSFSVHDGPGIRTTVFLKGCPLRCPWCHSPESQMFQKQVCHMPMRCMGAEKCGVCLTVCQQKAISLGDEVYSTTRNETLRQIVLNRELCNDCCRCAESCYSEALFVSGKDYTPEELFEKVYPDLIFYKKSDGGVTLSGGEPVSQAEFSIAFLKLCKEQGIHTALDTTGFSAYENYSRILPYTDLFLYDLKHMDSAESRRVIGVPNELILENARRLAAQGAVFQIRIPVIPGFNDGEENLRRTGEFCRELGKAVQTVQLLPYHAFGAAKYERLQRNYPMPESVKAPSEERMQEILTLMQEYVPHTVIH